MKARTVSTGYDMYFRANQSRAHRKAAGSKHRTAKAHTKKIQDSIIFCTPDEQMSEPPVVPKDERRYWH